MVQREMRPGMIVQQQEEVHSKEKCKNEETILNADMVLTLKEALLGFSRGVEHLDGRTVTVAQTKITKPGETKRLKGEGMPHHNFPSEFGDLVVKFQIKMPAQLSGAQREAVESLF